MRSAIILWAALAIGVPAPADVRLVITSSTEGYGLVDPSDPLLPTYSWVEVGGINHNAYDYYAGNGPFVVGAYPPADYDTSQPTVINLESGAWGYIWLQFDGDAPANTIIRGMTVEIRAVDSGELADVRCSYYLCNDMHSSGFKRWNGPATAPDYPEWTDNNPQVLAAPTAYGIAKSAQSLPEQLYSGTAAGALALLGAVGAVPGSDETTYEISITALDYEYGTPGETYAAQFRFENIPGPCDELPETPTDWIASTVVDGLVGEADIALATLPDGEPALAFIDSPAANLWYAWRSAGVWELEVVDDSAGAKRYPSLCIQPDGAPAIAYHDVTTGSLRFASRADDQWHSTLVDDDGVVGRYADLALLPTGDPAICYYDSDLGDLKYAWRVADQWYNTVVRWEGDVGTGARQVILPGGEPAIAYYNTTLGSLEFAWFFGFGWVSSVVDPAVGGGSACSLALRPETGQPMIAYARNSTTSIHLAWADEGGWSRTGIDCLSPDHVACNLVITPDGTPAIAYMASAAGVPRAKYAWIEDDTWFSTAIDDGVPAARDLALAARPFGQPLVAYVDAATGALRVTGMVTEGDLNCDGRIDLQDINPFVLALASVSSYYEAYPDCNHLLGDINSDGWVDLADITPFVILLTTHYPTE